MSTRSATIIKQTTYYTEMDVNTEELMRFYRHCDGYPQGHGMELAQAIKNADCTTSYSSEWLSNVLKWFFDRGPYATSINFEPYGCQHGDLEYLYVVEGIVDRRWGKTKSGRLPITISVYGIGWDEDYADAEKREPIFSGTAYEYIERFGNGEN